MNMHRIKGTWTISNLKGWVKTFSSAEQAAAIAWAKDRTDPPTKAELDRQWRANVAEAERKKTEKLEHKLVVQRKARLNEMVEDVLANSLDGGDPTNYIDNEWLDANNLTHKDLDAAANEAYNTTKGLYGVLAQSWDDRHNDQMADGHADPHAKNPWR